MRSLSALLHWGPILALGLIGCIAYITGSFCALALKHRSDHANEMFAREASFYQPGGLGQNGVMLFTLELLFWCGEVVLLLWSYCRAVFRQPGVLRRGWLPQDAKDKAKLQWCNSCDGAKAPRVHHCKLCKRCVHLLDHHCPWINGCVGEHNHRDFVLFVCYTPLACLHAAALDARLLLGGFPPYTTHAGSVALIGTACAMALVVGSMVGYLGFFQVSAVMSNRTEIEEWIEEKAETRREGGPPTYPAKPLPPFVFPYDVGRWENWHRVMGKNWWSWWLPGIELPMLCGDLGETEPSDWPVLPGCDQFTLSLEQLSQKAEKDAKAVRFTAETSFSAGCCSSCCWGPSVACSAPELEEPRLKEPRLKLAKGDKVHVTRSMKGWLYGVRIVAGERGNDGQMERYGGKPGAKGWFPAKVVGVGSKNHKE